MSNAPPKPDLPYVLLEDLPLQQYLTFRISRVQAKLNAQGARVLMDTVGLTLTQWRVVALIGAVGQTRLSDLSREAALDKGLLSRNVKNLVNQGVVTSIPDDIDHRVQHLSLSDKGQDIFDRALPATRKRQNWLRADLSVDEINTFRRVLDKLEIAAEKTTFEGE
ncbi:MarR family winged helix-turn-helix transcriptional regulator [Planktotalea sp.]|uniref:MarR family winged helix-turn-helix transcriptional regulator n=1 Tax=Planktotalea sp. TaxID=2029877 RepID=UPI0035C831B0